MSLLRLVYHRVISRIACLGSGARIDVRTRHSANFSSSLFRLPRCYSRTEGRLGSPARPSDEKGWRK
ncbi:MAG TPA: hypothetical protein DCY79_18645, partial [Planctomycetaceae bacterium]|nr:hypothetical protein [Planctomycetaceae bacterium]